MAVYELFSKKMFNVAFLLFRIVFGLMYMLHGFQKLGWLGGNPMSGFMLFIGICEALIGLALALGFLTRLAASGGVVIMIGALITAHWPRGWMPLGNGEAVWLNLAAFLLLISLGAGKLWSADKAVFRKEVF